MKGNKIKPGNHYSPWTIQELRYVEKQYGHQKVTEIAMHLQRSVTAVRMAAASLGLTAPAAQPWSEEEKQILMTHYSEGRRMGWLMEQLPGRNRKTIYWMADKLGLVSAYNWTKKECDILRQYYPSMGSRISAMLPGRESYAIRFKAMKMGLRFEGTGYGTAWTPEEKKKLLKNIHLPLTTLSGFFPDRTRTAVKTARETVRRNGEYTRYLNQVSGGDSDADSIMANNPRERQTGFRPWSDSERKLLENNMHLSVLELQAVLFPDRTYNAVEKARERLLRRKKNDTASK